MRPTKKLLASSCGIILFLLEVLWVLEYQYQGITGSASASGDTMIPIKESEEIEIPMGGKRLLDIQSM